MNSILIQAYSDSLIVSSSYLSFCCCLIFVLFSFCSKILRRTTYLWWHKGNSQPQAKWVFKNIPFYIISDLPRKSKEASCSLCDLQDWGFLYHTSTGECWWCRGRWLRADWSVNFLPANITCLSFCNFEAQWHFFQRIDLFGICFLYG